MTEAQKTSLFSIHTDLETLAIKISQIKILIDLVSEQIPSLERKETFVQLLQGDIERVETLAHVATNIAYDSRKELERVNGLIEEMALAD